MAERILVVRNRFIGDTVLAIPFLRNLRRRFPDAVIDVLVEPAARDVLADCPYVNEIVTWTRPRRGLAALPRMIRSTLALAGKLRTRGYTRAYVLKRSLSSCLLIWAGRIPVRIGFAKNNRSQLLSKAVKIRRDRHEAELFLDLLRIDGIDVDDGRNENWVSPAAAAKVEKILAGRPRGRPRVFVAPRSTDVDREWPADRMACILRWLVEQRGCEIFFCGAANDTLSHAEIRGKVGPGTDAHIHDLSLDLTLREACALISRMDVCLGVDTGLPHIAASFGLPTAVLYGPTDPAKWHPWKTVSAVVRAPSSAVAEISVGQVSAAMAGLLDSAAARSAATERPASGLKTIDLRTGRHRYEVYLTPPSDTPAPGRTPPSSPGQTRRPVAGPAHSGGGG